MPEGMTLLSDPAVAVSLAKAAAKEVHFFCAAAWYTRGMRRGDLPKTSQTFLDLRILSSQTTGAAVTAATHNVHAESCKLIRERMYRCIRNETVLELLLGGIIDREPLTWQAESCTGKDPRRTTDECRGAEVYIAPWMTAQK